MTGNVIQMDVYRKARAIEPFCTPTIDETMDGYLHDIRRIAPPSVYHDSAAVLDVLCHHLDEHGPETLLPSEVLPFETSARSYCSMLGAQRMLDNLDHFFRYCLLREISSDSAMRASTRDIIFDFCEWLSRRNYITPSCLQRVNELKEKLEDLDLQSARLSRDLTRHLAENKTLKRYVEKVDFGRHDVFKIAGDRLWLEVWSLPVLPTDLVVGPFKLPPALLSELHRGWMIESKLGKTASGEWEMIEVGAIHPSLPF
ncbi:MAG: hypothetical protein K2W95_19180 [Candidatus Obscuribacterales bacterium]|nr:hypothetical protein [Candidatus Obscuribacterales bacterium]